MKAMTRQQCRSQTSLVAGRICLKTCIALEGLRLTLTSGILQAREQSARISAEITELEAKKAAAEQELRQSSSNLDDANAKHTKLATEVARLDKEVQSSLQELQRVQKVRTCAAILSHSAAVTGS